MFPKSENCYLQILLTSFIGCMALVLVDWGTIASGFNLLPGDKYDSVIIAAILEHWAKVFAGNATWTEVGYFYPYTNTIAQTDAFLLVGVFYTPFRWLGSDPLLAAHLASLVVKLIGFFGFFAFGRVVGRWSLLWAIAGAVIFTISNGMTSHSDRVQLATVAFAPWLALSIYRMIEGVLQDNCKKATLFGIISALFFGAWCLTCLYMAWFFGFFCLGCLVIVTLTRPKELTNFAIGWLRRCAYGFSAIVAMAVLAIIPFVSVYLPKSRETGVRAFADVRAYLPKLESIFQVGDSNYLFGQLYRLAVSSIDPKYIPHGEYYNTGINILLISVFLMGCVTFIAKKHAAHKSLWSILSMATLFTWFLTIDWGIGSAWWLIYKYLPGAQALRVVSIYQIFLAFPVTAVACNYLSHVKWQDRFLPLFVIGVLFLAELNSPILNLNRRVELERVAFIHVPPSDCRSFYTSAWPDQDKPPGSPLINGYYPHNVTAMFVSQLVSLPTLNGFASFNPPDWVFGFPLNRDYDARVLGYARKHKILQGLCKLDLATGTWSTWSLATNTSFINIDACPSSECLVERAGEAAGLGHRLL